MDKNTAAARVDVFGKSVTTRPSHHRASLPKDCGTEHFREFEKRMVKIANETRAANPSAGGSNIFSLGSSTCPFVDVMLTKGMATAQMRWARYFLIDTWYGMQELPRASLNITDDLRLALSWFTGVDAFEWDASYVSVYYMRLCRVGRLKQFLTNVDSNVTKKETNMSV